MNSTFLLKILMRIIQMTTVRDYLFRACNGKVVRHHHWLLAHRKSVKYVYIYMCFSI